MASDGQLMAQALSCVRDDRTLFSGLGFQVSPRQVLLVEGRNGCGKTSLLHILCGIRRQDDGEVSWCGEPISRLGAQYYEQVAYVGHADGVKGDLTVEENLQVARALGKPGAISLDHALAEVNLDGFQDVLTRNLSAGQRRRLALARLLVTESRLWILDEPFTSLDRHGIAAFTELMEAHTAAGGMVVMTSHHDIAFPGADVQRIDLSA
jgi:heme exporter protein A